MSPPNPRHPTAQAPPGANLLLQPDGTVHAVDVAALQLLRAQAGLLWLDADRLAATDATALQRCLARAQAGQPAGLALRRAGRLPLTLCAWPLGGGAVQVTLRDPEAERPDPALLRDLFGLTPAEAHVATGLALGQRTADIAAALGVQPNTVQAHLKSIYAKTGCRHQAALLSLVLRSAAMQAVPQTAHTAAHAAATHLRDAAADLARLGIAAPNSAPEESGGAGATASAACHTTTTPPPLLRDSNR